MNKTTWPLLDSSLYPQVWHDQTFTDAHQLLMAMLVGTVTPDPQAFTQRLLATQTYLEWINATVYGRYIHRSFSAFYQQTEDSFNHDVPALFRTELTRHAQYLPAEQVLFFAGHIPKSARLEKLLTTTVNPATAIIQAEKHSKKGATATAEVVVNQITVIGKQVLGFPIRHNKRTSERTRNEVLVLDFYELRLVKEVPIERSNIGHPTLLRCYELR